MANGLSRRASLRLGCGGCLGLAGFGLAQGAATLNADVAQAAEVLPQRFSRPAIDSDEGGLWALMDREEARLRRSPFVVRDASIHRYLQDLVCQLAGDHCPDARSYLVRTPLFNASMAPNGMMQVWTGLLLRMDNEAQLAAVLGHEIGHYLERHSVERLRDAKSRAAAAQFMALFGAVGALGQLGVLSGAFAFSREHETRADRLGMHLLKQAGYDGNQAALVWDNLLGELKIKGGEDVGKRSPMMATHPPVATRRDDLQKLAGESGGRSGELEFRLAIAPYRLEWLRDEIKRGQYEESLVLFNRKLAHDVGDPQLLFARGEVYRQRNGKDDLQKATDDLLAASQSELAPPDVWRALGLTYKQRSQAERAIDAFEKYLAHAPESADSALIKHYLLELKP